MAVAVQQDSVQKERCQREAKSDNKLTRLWLQWWKLLFWDLISARGECLRSILILTIYINVGIEIHRLTNLINFVIYKKINKVIIEHKDILTRFQYNLIEKFFNSYCVEIIHIEKNDVSEEEDLVTDMVSLMASFSGKMYGRRSAKRRKEAKVLKENEENSNI